MINRVILVGRLTRDPNELRRTGNDLAFASFTVAVDNRFAKTEENRTNFINCVVFGKSAEFLTNYAKKGSLVGIEGRLQSRSYDDKDGKRVYVTDVVCDNVQLLESKSVNESRMSQTNNTGYQSQVRREPSQSHEDTKFENYDMTDDVLPF